MSPPPFVQAKTYKHHDSRKIRVVVIHDMEAPEGPRTAESCARYFATTDKRASAHYAVDVDSVVQCVRDMDEAAHAPGCNRDGIGIEHAGYAAQSERDWLDPYSTAMLREQSAPLVADLCATYHLPIVFLDAAALLRGEKGITTHAEVTKAYHRSTHTDPGPDFPMAAYLRWVSEASGQPPPPDPPQEIDTVSTIVKVNESGTLWNISSSRTAITQAQAAVFVGAGLAKWGPNGKPLGLPKALVEQFPEVR